MGPVAERNLDEVFGLSVSLPRVRSGADMLDAEPFADAGECERFVAGAVVGHDAIDFDVERAEVEDGGLEEGDGAVLLLVGEDVDAGESGMIVDGDVNELPTDAAAAALAAPVMRWPILSNFPSLIDVDVYNLARLCRS
jgi:hypothetical protein